MGLVFEIIIAIAPRLGLPQSSEYLGVRLRLCCQLLPIFSLDRHLFACVHTQAGKDGGDETDKNEPLLRF